MQLMVLVGQAPRPAADAHVGLLVLLSRDGKGAVLAQTNLHRSVT